jgi:hypothetical protein
MPTMIFDGSATKFSTDCHPERPALPIMTAALRRLHQHLVIRTPVPVSRGNVLNWPIPPRSDAERDASAVRQTLDRLVEFDLDVVLVSAGFDAYARDPVRDDPGAAKISGALWFVRYSG